MTGFFISLEGIDGCGKTTQWNLLKEYLKKENKPHKCVREPGSTQLGERLRTITKDSQIDIAPIAEAYLYATCRAQLVASIIKPALEQGEIVVCDRFLDSSLVYQGYARTLGQNTVWEINKHAVLGIWPDITFFLDIPVSVSLDRTAAKQKDRMEMQNIDFYNKVCEGYKKTASEQQKRIVTINGELPEKDIHEQIAEKLKKINK